MKKMVATITALLMLSGCGLFGGVQPESVNQSFYLAYALVQSGYDTVEIAILGGQIKTQSDARKFKDPLDKAKADLDVAKALFNAGDTFNDGVFDGARTTLVALQQALIALGAEDTRPDLIPGDQFEPVDRGGNPMEVTP